MSVAHCLIHPICTSLKKLSTVCVEDCGLHNQNIDMIILFACLVDWLDSSPVEKI
jgi:hypothetical protein